MHRTVIVITDAARARLFTYERKPVADGLRDDLVEVSDLVNPALGTRPAENGCDDRHAYIELDPELTRNIVAEVERLLKKVRHARLIVCASPYVLGDLRDAADTLRRDGLIIDEYPCDLVELTTPQIRDQLADFGLLPARAPRPRH
jgi:protein required for attachment to host cells